MPCWEARCRESPRMNRHSPSVIENTREHMRCATSAISDMALNFRNNDRSSIHFSMHMCSMFHEPLESYIPFSRTRTRTPASQPAPINSRLVPPSSPHVDLPFATAGLLYIQMAQNPTNPDTVAAMPEIQGHAPEMTKLLGHSSCAMCRTLTVFFSSR